MGGGSAAQTPHPSDLSKRSLRWDAELASEPPPIKCHNIITKLSLTF